MPVRIADLVALGLAEDAISRPVDAVQIRDAWPIGLKGGGQSRAEPPVIVRPSSASVAARIVRWATATGRTLQVHGGRSNVVGALDGRADVVLETLGLDAIGALDPVSMTVTVGAGVFGARLEAFLDRRGFSLGHQPQSLLTSTVGGWVATRATGAASAMYGGIERLVCGIECVLPSGELVRVAARPRAPGGLDLAALLCGTEGSLAVITQVTLSIARRLPQDRLVAFFPEFDSALQAQRVLVQDRLPVAVLRALDPVESAAVAPDGSIPGGACLLIVSLEAREAILNAATRTSRQLIRSSGGRPVEPALADDWWLRQYAPPGLIEGRNLPVGAMFDTIELGVLWSLAGPLARAIDETIRPLVQRLWLHSSHPYASGTCLYLAFWIKEADDAAALERCRAVWAATLQLVEERGGTYGHHHGIGAARSQRYLDTAEGRLHQTIKAAIDPRSTLAARLLGGVAPTPTMGVSKP